MIDLFDDEMILNPRNNTKEMRIEDLSSFYHCLNNILSWLISLLCQTINKEIFNSCEVSLY